MFRKKKVKNIVPDDYEFLYSYEIEVKFKPSYKNVPWSAECINENCYALAYGETKEEAVINIQNSIYHLDLERRLKTQNPDERFTIPPIRKFS